jgi:hypothetical protein
MKSLTLIFLAIALCGCALLHPKPTSQPTTAEFTLIHNPPTAGDPRDAQPSWQALVHLDIYQFSIPIGQISKNEVFWKQVDETALGSDLSRRLYKNGLRCGIVPKSEWSFFRDMLVDKAHPVVHQMIDGFRSDAVQLQLTRNVDDEDIFFLNASGDLEGHSYKNCMNLVNLSFEPIARRPGAVRVALCPTVQEQTVGLEYTGLNTVQPVYLKSDRLYDTAVRADITDDSFLIVSPGDQSRRSTSIGGSFFIKNDTAQQLEQVLLIIPTFLQFDGRPITISTEALPHH